MTDEKRAARRSELLQNLHNQKSKMLQSQIAASSPYSVAINPFIRNLQELYIYVNAELKESQVGRPCLIAPLSLTVIYTQTGELNSTRMKAGKPPCMDDGMTLFHLHHIGQKADSPFAELPESIHNAPGSNKVLHNQKKESWRDNPDMLKQFAKQKEEHWKTRYELMEKKHGREESK